MTGLLRTGARFAVVSALVLGSVPLGGVVDAADIRTETKLAGFAVTVEASPLRVLLDDPNLAVPHDPGTAIVEGNPNYTLASVSAGPNARAVTSALWPGNLFGEGLGQLSGGYAYPVKGEARYPDKPYTAAGVDGGPLSSAEALGLEARATADGTPTNKPGQVMVGDATSTSSARVTSKDEAVGSAFSAVKDVDLLAGTIHIGAVTTKVLTQSDGKKLVSTGTTTVSGLTIAGQQLTVDDKGLHAAGNGSALPGLTTPAQITQTLGITATVLNQSVTKTTNGVSRTAGGLVVDIDTAPLRALISPVTTNTDPVLNGLISNLPADQQGNFYYLVKATPHITFVFAEANSSSAATQPLQLDFPGFGQPSFPLPGGIDPGSPSSGTGAVITPGIADLPGDSSAVPRLPDEGGGSPVLQPPSAPSASRRDAGFGGIGAGPLLGAVVGSGLVGWLLLRLLGLAGGPLLLGCRLGAPTSLPNLRSVNA